MVLNQHAEKGATVLAGVTEADYQGEIGRQHARGKEEYAWNAEVLLGASCDSHVPRSKSMTSFNNPVQVEVPIAQTLCE